MNHYTDDGLSRNLIRNCLRFVRAAEDFLPLTGTLRNHVWMGKVFPCCSNFFDSGALSRTHLFSSSRSTIIRHLSTHRERIAKCSQSVSKVERTLMRCKVQNKSHLIPPAHPKSTMTLGGRELPRITAYPTPHSVVCCRCWRELPCARGIDRTWAHLTLKPRWLI